MKQRSILPFLIVLVALTQGCSKSNAPENKSIEGTWELTRIVASMTVNYSPGNGKLLDFNNGTYKMMVNGQVSDSGKYTLVYDDSAAATTGMKVSPGTFKYRIEYGSSPALNKIFIEVADNTLTLLTGATRIADSQVYTIYSRK